MHQAGFGVEGQVAASAQLFGWLVFFIILCAAQNGFDARHQLAHAKRLTDIIIRAEFQANYPVDFLTKDKQELHTLFTGTLLRSAAGAVIGFIGTATPVNPGAGPVSEGRQ